MHLSPLSTLIKQTATRVSVFHIFTFFQGVIPDQQLFVVCMLDELMTLVPSCNLNTVEPRSVALSISMTPSDTMTKKVVGK